MQEATRIGNGKPAGWSGLQGWGLRQFRGHPIFRRDRWFSFPIQSKVGDEGGQGGRLIAAAWVVEKIAGKGRAPIFQDLNQASLPDQVPQAIFHRGSDSDSIQNCLDDEVWIVEGGRPLRADRHCLAPLLKLPPVQTTPEAKADTGVALQILRMFRDAVRFEVCGRANDRKALLPGDADGNHIPLNDASTQFDSSDFRAVVPRFSEENRKANRALVEAVGRFAEQVNATPAQVALAWLLAQKPWIVPIPGTTKLSRLEENLGGAALELTVEQLHALEGACSAIQIEGERYPATHAKLVDR